MGVPLPHLVLPLSGCLSRHTPTRATRGEARGHRSVLAHNSLLMYPFFFFLWTCRRSGLSSRDDGMVPNVLALLWLHPCRASFDRVTLWTCGSLKGTQRDYLGCVVVGVCASPRVVGVDRRRACTHRRDVGPWYTARCQWCRDLLGHNGSARLCVAIAVVGPTMVTPEDRGSWG